MKLFEKGKLGDSPGEIALLAGLFAVSLVEQPFILGFREVQYRLGIHQTRYPLAKVLPEMESIEPSPEMPDVSVLQAPVAPPSETAIPLAA